MFGFGLLTLVFRLSVSPLMGYDLLRFSPPHLNNRLSMNPRVYSRQNCTRRSRTKIRLLVLFIHDSRFQMFFSGTRVFATNISRLYGRKSEGRQHAVIQFSALLQPSRLSFTSDCRLSMNLRLRDQHCLYDSHYLYGKEHWD